MDLIPKHKLRLFWTNEWSYGRSVEKWYELATEHWFTNATDIDHLVHVNPSLNLLIWAIDKLYYEKQLTEEERQRMRGMLNSPDEENIYMALTIMAQLKPKKFKR
jgi:hypothetical protein